MCNQQILTNATTGTTSPGGPPRRARRQSPAPPPPTSGTRSSLGDTMSSIAARYGTTVKKLAALNKIADPRVLKVGQVLLIP